MNIKKEKIYLFAYNFPHLKTQDFMCQIYWAGYRNVVVIAADKVELKIPPSSIRTSVKGSFVVHPQEIAKAFGWEYHIMFHDSKELEDYLEKEKPKLALISGARILKEKIISKFSQGIINFHPGLIPEVRGLDSLLWAIKEGYDLGVTAHFIDQRVDAGQIILKEKINIESDDTIFDLSKKIYNKQLSMLIPTLNLVESNQDFQLVGKGKSFSKMDPNVEKEVLDMVQSYVEKKSKESD